MADKKKPDAAPDASAEATTTERTLLEQIIFEGKVARDEGNTEQVKYAKEMVGEFVNQILGKHIQSAPDADKVKLIQERIAQIDELLTGYLNEIMHAERFQLIKAAWRGLHYLVSNTETSTTLKLRLLNATKKEVLDDLERAVEFDQSVQFKQLYEEEYGTFGGHPSRVLIGDYEFSRHLQDIAWLEKMSNVAAAAHAPFVAAASPKLFDMDSFTALGNPRDLAKIFESTELVKWKSFRDSEDSRYVALTLPHILLRLPYGPDTKPVEEFDFRSEEHTSELQTH